MLSIKRLGYVLLTVLGVCAIFVLYNINEMNNRVVLITNSEIEEREWLSSSKTVGNGNGLHFYVLGDEEKELYKDIYRNVCQVMRDMKLPWSKTEALGRDELADSNAILIFCDDIISKYVDLQKLADFVQKGGKAVLAAGVAEGYQDSYLQPVLGITEKTIKENYCSFNVSEGFFPLECDELRYNGYNASSWLSVRSGAEIYIEDCEKEVPIVYSYPYGKGETLVINATLLSDSHNAGILTAGLGELLETLVYPIMGCECVFLDNFPIVTYVNDSVCMKLYGRTTEAFVRDVVWPVFQGIAVRNELRYTSSVLSVSWNKDSFPAITESLFNTLGKSALQYGGELVYAAECRESEALYKNEDFMRNFENTFQNYDIRSLVMTDGQSVPEVISTLGQKINVVRGKMTSDKPENRMAVLDDYVVFPEATKGNNLEEDNMLAIVSALTSHGLISHTFDINRFISIDEIEASWDKDKIQLSEFEEHVFSQTDYLQKLSLSETGDIVKSYTGLEYGWEHKGNTIEISANQFVEGQPFWVRTKGKIVNAEGADYVEAAEGYYCVRLKATKAVLTLE